MTTNSFESFVKKMEIAGIAQPAIRAFENNYRQLVEGLSGLIPETSITPVTQLTPLKSIQGHYSPQGATLLSQTAVLKLNGGLGTSMGLERAKSLVVIKNGQNFLDFIARQIIFLRQTHQTQVRFLLMNSFSTSADTLKHLSWYPTLGQPKELELLQSKAPKVLVESFQPAICPENPEFEWCPPGHGDLYPSLLSSGLLEKMVADGIRYLFVSNADNLGATLDLDLLGYFAEKEVSFLMEVTERTPADRKGGHLAKRLSDGKLLLREVAQCPESDLESFQNVENHRFFNTNNLWIRLDHLLEILKSNGGFLPLPMIKNAKTVNPRDKNSAPVFQLETAMGAAIECFDKSDAILVPRTRFAPVKTTADLLALRSNAYRLTTDHRMELVTDREGLPPSIELDEHAKFVDQLDAMICENVPSLRKCVSLSIQGPVSFEANVKLCGNIKIVNVNPDRRVIKSGTYQDQEITL